MKGQLLTLLTIFVLEIAAAAPNQTVLQYTNVSLRCAKLLPGYIYRSWHRGHFGHSSSRYNSGGEELIRQIGGSKPELLTAARGDMAVDEQFTLTIGRAGLEDSSVFTCFQAIPSRDITKQNFYSYVHVKVDPLPEEPHPYSLTSKVTIVAAVVTAVVVLLLVAAISLFLHRLTTQPSVRRSSFEMKSLDGKEYKRLRHKSE